MRKYYPAWLVIVCTCFLFVSNISAQPASNKPAIFEAGKISDTYPNRDMAISPDGSELFYTIQFTKGLYSVIMHSVKKNGRWGNPEVASFSGIHSDLEPSFSPDGKTLYFSSSRPLKDTGAEKDFDIWYVTKANGVWQNPQNMDAPVNTVDDEFYASVTKSGNLYITRGTEGRNDDIKMCRFVNGHYDEAVSLSDSVNSAGFEFNAYVDPDETFILYTAYRRPGGKGSGDIFISFRNSSGAWGKGINLLSINSASMDYCPFVSADKKWLYFTSDRPAFTAPFSTKQTAKTIRQLLNNPGNGFDDIYVVDFEEILKLYK